MKVAPSGKNKTIAPQCLLLISQIDFFLNFEFDFTYTLPDEKYLVVKSFGFRYGLDQFRYRLKGSSSQAQKCMQAAERGVQESNLAHPAADADAIAPPNVPSNPMCCGQLRFLFISDGIHQ